MLIGCLLDVVFGDPKRGHPVALFGRAAAKLEQITYRDGRVAGAVHVSLLVGAVELARRGTAAATRQVLARGGHRDGHLGSAGRNFAGAPAARYRTCWSATIKMRAAAAAVAVRA